MYLLSVLQIPSTRIKNIRFEPKPLDRSLYQKITFLFLIQNIHMLKLITKKILKILCSKICLSKPMFEPLK